MNMITNSPAFSGTSTPNIAIALSEKLITWTLDRTTIKNTLDSAIPWPATKIAGNEISAIPIKVAGAIAAAFSKPKKS